MSRPGHVRKTGGSRAIVLLHGIGAGAEMFAPVIDALGRDHDVIGWNLPGYGGTPLLAPMTFPGLSATLLAFLDGLGLERVALLGHSIGGMLAQDFVARHPGRVRTLVLSATTAAFGSRDGEFQKRFVTERLAPLDRGRTVPELAREFVPDLVGPAAAADAVPTAIAAMSKVPEETYREAIRCLATFDARETLGQIAAPTLLVAGEVDSNAPAPTMRRMAEKMQDARYVELAGTGHLAPLECPDAYVATLRDFLTRTDGAKTPQEGAVR
ncbi:alpha/beta fold hydrolase [Stappia sp.]|uniref:alpha/beta fold hydrolase n=1 Tax=Stappia sp. TaxID=1870903 RepID=UPI003A99A52A